MIYIRSPQLIYVLNFSHSWNIYDLNEFSPNTDSISCHSGILASLFDASVLPVLLSPSAICYSTNYILNKRCASILSVDVSYPFLSRQIYELELFQPIPIARQSKSLVTRLLIFDIRIFIQKRKNFQSMTVLYIIFV